MIMFEMLGIKTSLAFIPFYNTYLIYKEYKGRVWKKNWGVLYVGTLIFSLLIISVVTYIILVDDLMGIIISSCIASIRNSFNYDKCCYPNNFILSYF